MSIKTIWGTAGCGKTTHLQKEFVNRWGGTYGNVGLVTFRRNTANQIKEDLAIMLKYDSENLPKFINTMHGMCLRNIDMQDYKVVDGAKISEFNKQFGYKFSMNEYGEKSSKGMLECYTWLKNNLLPFEQVTKYKNLRSLKKSPSIIIKQLNDYENFKHDNRLIDFTDMLTTVLENGIVPDFETLFVDEFQDFTPLQIKIFEMWCDTIPNVTIAGDPLQSIYGFWGAKPDYFNSYTENKTILPKSYRLPRKVWETGKSILKRVGLEYPDIETNGNDGDVCQISYKKYSTHDKIGGAEDNSVYHLVRSRYQAPSIAGMLADRGILFSGLHGWGADLLSVANVMIKIRTDKPLDRSDIKSLFKVYPRKHFNTDSIKDFENQLENMRDSQFIGVSGGLVKPSLYELAKSDTPLGLKKTSLRQKMIINVLDNRTDSIKASEIKTTLETIHGAKGGERDIVFLHTAITPKIRRGMRQNKAEEARVWFTGVTRAHKELIVVKDAGDNYNIPKVV